MKEQGYGEGYGYAHDEEEGISDLECLPAQLAGRVYYTPKESGFETRIASGWPSGGSGATRAARKGEGQGAVRAILR